jgi:hypothetical protein
LEPSPGKETGEEITPGASKELLHVTATANPPEDNDVPPQPIGNLSTKAPTSKGIRNFFHQAPTIPPPPP